MQTHMHNYGSREWNLSPIDLYNIELMQTPVTHTHLLYMLICENVYNTYFKKENSQKTLYMMATEQSRKKHTKRQRVYK